jgi:hypothetical protein
VFNSACGDTTTPYTPVSMDHVSTIHCTQTFILFGALLVEPAIRMVLLTRVLKSSANRRANMLTGGVVTALNLATIFVGAPTLGSAFLTTVRIATGIAIVWPAWKWAEPTAAQSAPAPSRG